MSTQAINGNAPRQWHLPTKRSAYVSRKPYTKATAPRASGISATRSPTRGGLGHLWLAQGWHAGRAQQSRLRRCVHGMRRALEAAGVEFITGTGVRLRT